LIRGQEGNHDRERKGKGRVGQGDGEDEMIPDEFFANYSEPKSGNRSVISKPLHDLLLIVKFCNFISGVLIVVQDSWVSTLLQEDINEVQSVEGGREGRGQSIDDDSGRGD
jgi:hypothetical protein